MWWNPDVGSKRTADDSKRFHGQIQRVEDPFKDPLDGKLVMTPPNRPQCRCGMRTVRELPKELVWIGGIMYDGRYVQKEASMHKIAITTLDIEKAWTDEAREKALEARRRKMRPEDFEELRKFKESLKGLDEWQILDKVREIRKHSDIIDNAIHAWYSDRSMAKLDWFATQVFGMDEGNSSKKWGSEGNERNTMRRGAGAAEYKVILGMYFATQAWLDRMYPGTDEITVYRGVDGKTWEKFKNKDIDNEIDFSCYNLSCWTTEAGIARKFLDSDGGVVVETKVPKKQVLLSWHTGESSYDHEKEITVMGKNFKGRLHDILDEGNGASRRETREGLSKPETYNMKQGIADVSVGISKKEALKNIAESGVPTESQQLIYGVFKLDGVSDSNVNMLSGIALKSLGEFKKTAEVMYPDKLTEIQGMIDVLSGEDVAAKRALLKSSLFKDSGVGSYLMFTGLSTKKIDEVAEWIKIGFELT